MAFRVIKIILITRICVKLYMVNEQNMNDIAAIPHEQRQYVSHNYCSVFFYRSKDHIQSPGSLNLSGIKLKVEYRAHIVCSPGTYLIYRMKILWTEI